MIDPIAVFFLGAIVGFALGTVIDRVSQNNMEV
jgi:hypothetical protein